MHFDLTVRLGDVLIGLGVFAGTYKFYGRFTVLESKVNDMWDWMTGDDASFHRKTKHSSAHD